MADDEAFFSRLADLAGAAAVSAPEIKAVLDFARVVAHTQERRYAPVASYALGLPLGTADPVHVIAAGPQVADEATFHDPQGMVHAAYGVPVAGDPTVVVLDPNVRVAAAYVHHDLETTLAEVASAVADVTIVGEGSTFRRHAPVLFVPNALDQTLCGRADRAVGVLGDRGDRCGDHGRRRACRFDRPDAQTASRSHRHRSRVAADVVVARRATRDA